jgi:hypothetical protein
MEVLSWNDLVASDDRNVTLQVAFFAYPRLPSLTGVGRPRRPHISEVPPIRKIKPVKVPDDEEEAYIDPRD